MSGTIYILTNEAMPGYVKIGRTDKSIIARMKDLDGTSLPLPFECYYACTVNDSRLEEQWLHSIFSDRRVRNNREFFKVDPERVVVAIRKVQIEESTPENLINVSKEQKTEIEEAKQKRANFDFEKCDIPIGAILAFTRDSSIKATVLPKNKIEWDGKTTSLSQSAQKLLGYKRQVAGTLYWMYEDETLDERRRRLEEEG